MRCVSHPPSPPRLQPERSNASFRCGRPLVCGDGKLSCNAIAVACLAAIRRECEDEGESMPSMQWGKGANAAQCQNGIGSPARSRCQILLLTRSEWNLT